MSLKSSLRALSFRLADGIRRIRQPSVRQTLPTRELQQINALEPAMVALDAGGLQALSRDLRRRARSGVAVKDMVVEGFALVREAARRVLGLRAFDVQILAAISLCAGIVAEMKTGEGKTLAAVFPSYLHALSDRGVHVLTVNDYLANRDAEQMGKVHEFLGLSVGCSREGMSCASKRAAYASDITYVTAKEAGFDHLRDQICSRVEDLMHRATFHFGIVDEVDSILIDEARIPLVLAGSTTAVLGDARRAKAIVGRLSPGDHAVDSAGRNVRLTPGGVRRVEEILGCANLYDDDQLLIHAALNEALHAEMLLRRDVDYLVRDGEIEVVDELTGRIAENRRWPDGLQAALAAKEDLPSPREGVILGSTTLQHFLGGYESLCGMTGTAVAAATELDELYGMHVVVVPRNVPCIRVDEEDAVFVHRQDKEAALLDDVLETHRTGQPVLVGTASVAESERLGASLRDAGVVCSVLNARNDAEEARIVAEAGARGAVTISTNMAGRGTDIKLGGADESLREQVALLGGLRVLGTHRHESRRIDDQLRGRSGRQGDPGSSRFYVSLEDDLFQRHGLQDLLPRGDDGQVIVGPRTARTDSTLTAEIARAQRIVDGQNAEIRKTLCRYTKVVEDQRRIIQSKRQAVLHGRVPLTLLREHAADRYNELESRHGAGVLAEVERQLTLFHIDRCWSDYLALVAHLRDGVHLLSVAGNPLPTFHGQVIAAFSNLLRTIQLSILQSFSSAEISEAGIDMAKSGLHAPTSTWTYLVNDTPFWMSFYDRILTKVGNAMKRVVRTFVSRGRIDM